MIDQHLGLSLLEMAQVEVQMMAMGRLEQVEIMLWELLQLGTHNGGVVIFGLISLRMQLGARRR